MVNGRRRKKRKKKSTGSTSSADSDISSPDLVHKPEGNAFVTLLETPASVSLGETANIIAEANDSLLNEGLSQRKIAKARKMPGVDQELLKAISDVVDQKLEEKLEQKLTDKLHSAVETLKTSFAESLGTLEARVKKVEDENKKLRDEIENLSMGEGADATTLARTIEPVVHRTVEPVVEKVLDAKQVLVRPEYDYDRTLAVVGIYHTPGENEKALAEQLVHEGLNLPNTKVVRAKREPYNYRARRPGIFKIELESKEKKMEALSQTGRLATYRALGNRVVVRSSQTYEHRQNINNWRTFIREQGLEDELTVTKGGNLVKITTQQQGQFQRQQSQFQQQQGHYQQQQGQYHQQQGQFQQFQHPQGPSHQQQGSFQQQQQPSQVFQQSNQVRPPPQPLFSQAPTYANVTQSQAATNNAPFNFTGRQQTPAPTPVTNSTTNPTNPGVMTNQFKFRFDNPTSAATNRPAPGY